MFYKDKFRRLVTASHYITFTILGVCHLVATVYRECKEVGVFILSSKKRGSEMVQRGGRQHNGALNEPFSVSM